MDTEETTEGNPAAPVLCPNCGHSIDLHSRRGEGEYETCVQTWSCTCILRPSEVARLLITPTHRILTTPGRPECSCGEAPPLGASAWRWLDQHIAQQNAAKGTP